MRWLTVAACLSAFLIVPLGAQDKYPTVNYKKAADHMGEIVWVKGTVLKVLNESEGTYLCFSNNEKYVRVLIPTEYVANFEGGFKHRYVGKTVKVVGKVSKFGSQLILGINEPKRIKIVEKST
jgi:hypothetical protein